jgi:hypothetical protein
MAKQVGVKERKKVVKLTCQGGSKPKTSTMNKDLKRSYKKYRGQGK